MSPRAVGRIAVACLLLLHAVARAQYYVQQGGTPSGNCPQGAPCSTIARAAVVIGLNGGTGTIFLLNGTLTGTGNNNLVFSAGQVTITGPSDAIVDCGGSPGFNVSGSSSKALSITGITMRNCRPALNFLGPAADGAFTNVSFIGNGDINQPWSGAVVANSPTVPLGSSSFRPVFTGCLFKDNVAVGGAAVAFSSGSRPTTRAGVNIVLDNCTFINNTASYRGGAICLYYMGSHGQTSLTNLVFTGNKAITDGATAYLGLLFNSTKPAQPDLDNWTVDRSELTDPSSSSDAYLGVINIYQYYVYATRLRITNSLIYGGRDGLTTAALTMQGNGLSALSDVVVRNTTIVNPAANHGGAGILLDQTPDVFDNLQIEDNAIGNGTIGRGAGVYIYGSGAQYTWANCRVSGNRAAEGAGLWAESITNVAWLNTTFDANVALNGGAAFVGAGSNIAFQSCTFSNNVATLGTGGAITIAQGGRATISGGTFSSNSAALGGAVYTTSGGTLTVFDATFTGNSATNLGGGMALGAENTTQVTAAISRCVFNGNNAQSGGAVYASSAANVTITNGTYAGNTASIEGGAIYLQGNATTPVTLRLIGNVTFAANNAPAGGALALFGSQSDLGSAVLLPRPGDTVCCENRCIVCDTSSSAALVSSAGVVCPDPTVCPTPAPTTPPPPPPTTPPPATEGPFGPCTVVNNCGPPPNVSAALNLISYCCNGRWIVEQNATAPSDLPSTLEVPAGGSVVINNFWNLTVIDTLVIHIDGSGNKRQGQAALAKVEVYGDAYVDGRLEIIVDSDPQPSLDTTPVSVVAVVPASNGTLTGQFREPVRVTLAYAGAGCSSGAASQTPSSVAISALVSVDSKSCRGGGGGGLSRNGKIAVGVVCGVVGLLLLALLVFILIKTLAPDLAVRLGVSKPTSLSLGKSYSKRSVGRV